jgi:hypothetical protein
MLVDDGAARHFIPDAYVHAKFIGHVQTATTPMASSVRSSPITMTFTTIRGSGAR